MKVEIITPKFNFKHTGGVISILTKTGFGSFSDEFVRNIHGRITPRIRGFRQAREFYAPAYPLQIQDASEKPDFRPTLFWQPYLQLKGNKAILEFHASDMPGQYRVMAEGISAKGKIISSSWLLQVVEGDK